MNAYSFLKLSGLTSFLILAIIVSSCEQIGQIAEQLRVVSFHHKLVADSIPATQIYQWEEQDEASLRNGANHWIHQPTTTTNLHNDAQVFGDPTQGQSSLLIRSNNEQASAGGVTGILIEVFGPLDLNTKISTGRAELSFGEDVDAKYSTDASETGTYFEITIKRLDLVENVVSADFHFLAKNINDPEGLDPISVMDGTLLMSLR